MRNLLTILMVLVSMLGNIAVASPSTESSAETEVITDSAMERLQIEAQQLEQERLEFEQSSQEMEVERLLMEQQMRIDSLEMRLEKMVIEEMDNNPYATGEILNWGTGWNLKIQYATTNQRSFEIGYLRFLKSTKFFRTKGYLGNRAGVRVGFALGVTSFYDEIVINTKNETTYASSGAIFSGKLGMATPVLLNFISTSHYFELLYVIPSENGANLTANKWGLTMGHELEFWITKKSNFIIGLKTGGDFSAVLHTGDKKENVILPDEVRPYFGFKFYF